MKAAVLTVSDGVVAGTREDTSGDLLAELLAAEGYEVERRVVPDEAGEIAAAIVELGRRGAARAHDRRHRVAPARRHAGGDALGDRPGGARDRRGDPRRLAREDAARAALSRRRRRARAHARRQPPGSPGGCRDGFAVLRPALAHALGLLAGAETAHRQT